jgi:hypothetical protein
MINDLDEVLRQLLIDELPVKNGEIEIKFELPNREWSAKLNRPTLNLFLYDLRENHQLRQPEWEIERKNNGKMSKQRTPVRMDLHYLITAWAKEVEDEHHILTRTLLALFRHPTMPEHMLPEILQGQPWPIPVRVAQHDDFRNPADVWSALDNDLRPAIALTLTLALTPYAALEGPLVRTRQLRYMQAEDLPSPTARDEAKLEDALWLVGGEIVSDKPLEEPKLTLLERGFGVSIDQERRFRIGGLESGKYTLLLEASGMEPVKQVITVPSESYDIQLKAKAKSKGGD